MYSPLFPSPRRGWLFAILAGVLVLPAEAMAGAWTVPRRRMYGEYFYRVFQSKKQFDADGNSARRPKSGVFRDIRNEVKFEYGVTDWLNVLGSVPYQSAHDRNDTSDLLHSDVGDIYVRTKVRVFNKPVLNDHDPLVASLQLSGKIPSAYDANDSPGLGDGQVDVDSRVQVSQSWLLGSRRAATRASPRGPAARRPRALPRQARAQTPTADFASGAATSFQRGTAAFLYDVAQEYRQAGRYGEAAHELRKLLTLDPMNEQALRDLDELSVLMHSTDSPTQTQRERVMQESLSRAQQRMADRRRRSHEALAWADEPAEPMDAAPAPGGSDSVDAARVAFVNFEGGFTARNEGPANEVPLVFEAGFAPYRRLMLVGSLESVLSVRSTHEQVENYAKWGLRGIINLRGEGFATVFRRGGGPTVNLELGYNDIFAGRNTADAFEIFSKLGIFF